MLAQARCSGRVPLVTAVLGPSAGHGALVAPMSDFTVMSAHGAIFTAGPPVVFESTGRDRHQGRPRRPVGRARERADPQRAPPTTRPRSTSCARTSRYFPSSAWSYPPDATRRRHRTAPRARDARHRAAQRPARLRHARRDRRRVRRATRRSRCSPSSDESMVCALARLGGHPVAVIANQPQVDRRVDRRRRRRQGRALHHRRRLVPPAARVLRRQSRRAARHRLGASAASCAAARACTPRRRIADRRRSSR